MFQHGREAACEQSGSAIRHKRLFIEAVKRAAHSIDLPLIAKRVETEGERLVIAEMGIEGGQGQSVGDPAPWRRS